MRGKLFGLILLLLAVGVGVALFDNTGGPTDPPEIDGGKTGGAALRDPLGPAIGDPATDPSVPQSTRQDAPTSSRGPNDDEVFDAGGTLVVTGHVLAEGTRKAIAGAEVELVYPNGDEIESVTSAPDGSYRMEVVEGIPAVVAFRVQADGFASHAPIEKHIDGGQRLLLLDFELAKAFRIEGRVTAMKDGQPVADVDVEVRCQHLLFQDTWEDSETNDEGFYSTPEISGLPREGIDVWVDTSDYAPMVKHGLKLEAGQDVLRVDFVLWDTLTLVGTVLSSVTGRPLEDAEISAISRDPEFSEEGQDEVTEEDGAFQIEMDTLPYEGLMVLVSASDHAPTLIDPVPAPDRFGVIQLGQIALAPGITVSGLVRDARTGAPVGGGDVYLYAASVPDREDGDYVDTESIDAQGRFEIPLQYAPAKGAEMYIDADGHEPLRRAFDLLGNATQQELVLEVEPIILFRGSVRRKLDNKPMPGAGVRVLTGGSERDDEPYSRCRADGTFRIQVPNGDVSRFAVVIEVGGKRFPVGNLDNPPAGRFEIVKDYIVDVPPR